VKIHTMGQVRVTDDKDQPIKIEGWYIEMEPSDPQDAEPNQLILAFAARWALDKLIVAVDVASRAALKQWASENSRKVIKHEKPN
jgi:hypothetical protein